VVLPRWVELEGAFNVRDLAGLPAGGRVTASNVLYRGDNLDGLTPADVEVLTRGRGLRTVVDLRSEGELLARAEWLSKAGVDYRHIPLFDLTGEAGTDVRRDIGSDLPAAYRTMLALAAPAIAEIVGVVIDVGSVDGPVLVHCAAGKDRTGIVIAVLLTAVGVSREDVVADYLATGDRLAAVRVGLARRAMYRSDPDSSGRSAPLPVFSAEPIEAVLDVLRRDYGGAEGFLRGAGVSPDQVASLARVFLAEAGD
jgi:protein-tyrosine phosphatase